MRQSERPTASPLLSPHQLSGERSSALTLSRRPEVTPVQTTARYTQPRRDPADKPTQAPQTVEGNRSEAKGGSIQANPQKSKHHAGQSDPRVTGRGFQSREPEAFLGDLRLTMDAPKGRLTDGLGAGHRHVVPLRRPPSVHPLAGWQPSERCSEGRPKGCEVGLRALKPAQFLRRLGSELRS